MKKFITSFNGSRDFYELPLALAEINMLEKHVSDLYWNDNFFKIINLISCRFNSRYRLGLDSSYVNICYEAFARNILLRLLKKKNSRK